ncbi:carbonic anhydrase [Mesobacillus foraminis]|uniref:carbonic anhydrase n=1 Tax=Mesobacillus foraminis TaxID=279826 RepID=A0A4R2B0D4_9BACI|nr:carbonic anhydrase family protein [Mesobacillus foraminis]TCN19887.1 carbonic anhydrase [Mesobacillus foraminis]
MMKKITNQILTVTLSLALAACSVQSTKPSGQREEHAADTNGEKKESRLSSAHWSYEGDTGPEHWGKIDPANSACVNGSEQSPINIEFSQVQTKKAVEDLHINYQPALFTIMNNGHTVQANAVDEGNSVMIEGKEYELVQFHFHTPSEHQFNGQNYEMELHLVHKDMRGKIAVLGLMIKEGEENESLISLWNTLPTEKNEKDKSLNEPVHLEALLPDDRSAFAYDGSLTTPPCTEGVKWTVFEKPIEMSKQQIKAFRQIFPDNHRPVQAKNNHKIIKE